MSDVETSALAALPLKAGLFGGPDGGVGVVNVGRSLLHSPLQPRPWEDGKRLAQSCGNTHRHGNTAPGKKGLLAEIKIKTAFCGCFVSRGLLKRTQLHTVEPTQQSSRGGGRGGGTCGAECV